MIHGDDESAAIENVEAAVGCAEQPGGPGDPQERALIVVEDQFVPGVADALRHASPWWPPRLVSQAACHVDPPHIPGWRSAIERLADRLRAAQRGVGRPVLGSLLGCGDTPRVAQRLRTGDVVVVRIQGDSHRPGSLAVR